MPNLLYLSAEITSPQEEDMTICSVPSIQVQVVLHLLKSCQREASLIKSLNKNEETKINQVHISLGFKNMQKDFQGKFQHQLLAILIDK